MAGLRDRHLEYLGQLELVTGWTISRIAREAGLQPTTLTRYVNDPGHKSELSSRTLEKLRSRFGFGPGETPQPQLRPPARQDRAAEQRAGFFGAPIPPPRDVPVYAITAEAGFALEDGEASEALVLEGVYSGQMVTRPASLEGQAGLFAFFVPGHSMDPRFRMGELAIVDPNRPPRLGDDVLVTVGRLEDGRRSVLLKTLVGVDAAGIELEEYQPRRRFRVPAHRVLAVSRILSLEEILRN